VSDARLREALREPEATVFLVDKKHSRFRLVMMNNAHQPGRHYAQPPAKGWHPYGMSSSRRRGMSLRPQPIKGLHDLGTKATDLKQPQDTSAWAFHLRLERRASPTRHSFLAPPCSPHGLDAIRRLLGPLRGTFTITSSLHPLKCLRPFEGATPGGIRTKCSAWRASRA
jgi:hypothetical protein